MATRHNRRLRKKLHLGEFARYGFLVKLGCGDEHSMNILAGLSEDVLRPRGLSFLFMALNQVYINNATDPTSAQDREHVSNWLSQQADLDAPEVGPLTDDWYPPYAMRFDATPNNRRKTILVIAPGGKSKQCRTGIGPGRYPV